MSIAFEELGLAHMINVEAEKLQGAIGTLVNANGAPINPSIQAGSLAELLAANREVKKMLRTIIKKEMLLQFKFEKILDFLSTTTTTSTTSTTSTTTCDCSTDWDFAAAHTAQIGTGTPQAGVVVTAADICPDCLLNGSFFNFRFVSDDGTADFTFIADVFEVINCLGSGNENVMLVTGTGHIEDGAVGIDLELFDDSGTVFNTYGFVTDPAGIVIDECD